MATHHKFFGESLIILLSVALERRRTKFIQKTLLRSLHVAQAVVYRCYTDIDIILSFRFLCFVYCCITIIIVMVVYDFQSPLSRITMITQTLLLLLILVLLLFCFYLLLFHQLELVF